MRGPGQSRLLCPTPRAHGADIKDLSRLCLGQVEEGGPRLGSGPWSARPHQGSRPRSDFTFQLGRQPQARAEAAGSRQAALAWQACPEPLMEQCWTLRPRLSLTIQKVGRGKIRGGGGARAPWWPSRLPALGWVAQRLHCRVSETLTHSVLGLSGSRSPEGLSECETDQSCSEVSSSQV